MPWRPGVEEGLQLSWPGFTEPVWPCSHGGGGQRVPCLTPQDLSSPDMEAVHGRGSASFQAWLPRAFRSLQSSAIEDRGPTTTTWLHRAWPGLKKIVVKEGGAHRPGPGSPVPVLHYGIPLWKKGMQLIHLAPENLSSPVEASCAREGHCFPSPGLPRQSQKGVEHPQSSSSGTIRH